MNKSIWCRLGFHSMLVLQRLDIFYVGKITNLIYGQNIECTRCGVAYKNVGLKGDWVKFRDGVK